MFYSYDYKNLKYIPVLQNWFCYSGSYNLHNNYLNNDFVEYLFKQTGSDDNCYLIDFSGVFSTNSRSFEIFNSLSNKKHIFYNLDKSLYPIIKTDCIDYKYKDDDLGILITENAFSFYESIKGQIQSVPINIIRRQILECVRTEKDLYPLDSSNVLGNKYVDIKQIFYKPECYYLTIIQLAKTINRNYSNYDKIICSSFNGSVISTLIGQLLGKDTIYIMQLGPNISFRDRELIKKIEPNKRYIYIGDMICLGSEYKMAKTIVKLHNSDIVGGAVFAIYIKPTDDYKIESLVEINDGDEFDYKIIVKKDTNHVNI